MSIGYIFVCWMVGAEALASDVVTLVKGGDLAAHGNCMHVVSGFDGICRTLGRGNGDVGWCISMRMLKYLFLASWVNGNYLWTLCELCGSGLDYYTSCVLRRYKGDPNW